MLFILVDNVCSFQCLLIVCDTFVSSFYFGLLLFHFCRLLYINFAMGIDSPVAVPLQGIVFLWYDYKAVQLQIICRSDHHFYINKGFAKILF